MKWVEAWPPFRPKMGLEYFNIVPKSRPNYHLWWNESKLDRKYFCILILWISDPPQRSNWIRDYQKLQIFRTKVEDKIPRWFFRRRKWNIPNTEIFKQIGKRNLKLNPLEISRLINRDICFKELCLVVARRLCSRLEEKLLKSCSYQSRFPAPCP